MAGGHEEEAGFWPGYVAAVSGLVQGLLIMAMALGISIYALGRLAASATAGAKKAAVAPAAPPAAGQPPGPALPPFDAGAAPPLPPPLPTMGPQAASARGIPASPNIIVATVTFFGDAVDLPATSLGDVQNIIAAHKAGGAERWRLTLAANLENPRERRAGYLRLMALRGILIESGVAADRVQAQLVGRAAAGAGEGSAVAELQPLTAAGAPLVRSR